jgi:Protein kinase domain
VSGTCLAADGVAPDRASGRIRVVTDFDVTVGVTPPVTPAAGPARFAPGSMIAARYRLVALLGRGGMGEVYRADDLTLDQPVALKFLPDGVAADPARLAQFHNELRIARQVSHKNVCRLYDLGDADGRRFLTMEYVDGEDLASLLRRIGRFPQDKAIDVARQLCAGVAAAHERGVIHRDLKPANVMLDGDGNVRITDFGIATAAADAGGAIAGTPQYMAPELLAGKPASAKSDIYALGLILFEIFTGRRAHDAKTIGELKQLHDTGTTLLTPSAIVRDLDPAVERVIMRCLARDPEQRPASALTVAVALPGGDPLAAALAAGETPSPEMLVAAGESDALPIARGAALIAALGASIAVYASLTPLSSIAAQMPLDKPPAVLADRAQQILTDFGYGDEPADTDQNFIAPPDFQQWLVDSDSSTSRWSSARVRSGPAMVFWYRTSPRDLEPDSPSPQVTPTDPAMAVTGQSLVVVDTRGRLVEFRRIPPQRDANAAESPAPDWNAMFRDAGLAPGVFTPVPPEWAPKDFADTRMAWAGPSPDAANVRLRVEAAAYRGRIISVYVLGPWSRPRAQQPVTRSRTASTLRLFGLVLWTSVLAGSMLLARHHIHSRRADLRGASRLAVLCLLVNIAAWAIGGHHLSSPAEELNSFFRVCGTMLFNVALLWALYVALEPYGRRFWPDGLIGWTRLFAGYVRDPRIGREILIGAAVGAALIANDALRGVLPYLVGRPPTQPFLDGDVRVLSGFGALALAWAGQIYGSVQTALLITMTFVGLRLVVRQTWIAVVIGMIVVTAAVTGNVPFGQELWLYVVGQLLAIGIITLAIFRFGLLVTAVALIVDNVVTIAPILPRVAPWAALPGNLSIAVVLAAVGFGFYAARAGQPLLGAHVGPPLQGGRAG